jgi:catechol 2,3-dioxygenase-like lactoylglutathione lyase family enzyme
MPDGPTASRELAQIAAKGPLQPLKLSHVVLRTRNLGAARDWYLGVLNARVQYEDPMVCFMTYDDEHHRIGLVQVPGVTDTPAAHHSGLEHVSFAYRTLGDLLANYRRLKSVGIVPYWTINHGPTISLYYRDPDANRVELQYDVFDTAQGANQFVADHYAENFMGIIFDPEDMIRAFERGDTLEDIVKRPPLPPGKTPWDMHRP